jgi:hypothetical protein
MITIYVYRASYLWAIISLKSQDFGQRHITHERIIQATLQSSDCTIIVLLERYLVTISNHLGP